MKEYFKPVVEIKYIHTEDVLFISSPFKEVHDFDWEVDEEL